MTSNAAHLDLGKIQMFYFTIVLILVCAMTPGIAFASSGTRIDELPAMDSSMVAWLGSRHAGYRPIRPSHAVR